jgi:argininosuccinate lyase
MPQKRNPVAMEHVRAIASKALGQSLGVLTAVHNTPFGDINDVEDDLQPLVFSSVRDASRAVSLLGDTLQAAEFNLDLLQERAGDNFITVTELADVIVRREKLPFSKAHAIVAACVRQATAGDGVISHYQLRAAAAEVAGSDLSISAEELERALSAENFVAVRTVHGGPAPDETRRSHAGQRQLAEECKRWLHDRNGHLGGAAKNLRAEVRQATSR